jgi:glycosyltransferase involved in cell wall biosynthesis
MIITIIIPCYNEVLTIEVIIDQILSIKDYEKEIIVIDDYSTDGTLEVIKEKLSNKIR